MRLLALTLGMLCCSGAAAHAVPQDVSPASPAQMAVKEVTVFKDGHAFVVHQGRMATDASGRVVLDALPAPLLGTFWPYSAERDVPLAAVTASRRPVRAEQTAVDLRGLLEANPGALVDLVDLEGKTISGRIRSLPTRAANELRGSDPVDGREIVPARGGIVLVDTDQGVLALGVDRIRSVSFRTPPAARYGGESFRDLLTLAFAWPDRPRREIEVGMAYVQKGLRWIPSYRVTIGDAGKARLQLQATLVNELADLENVTANLVVGVPTFAFKDTLDPMALQETVARLGVYFDSQSASGFALSNAIMSQAVGLAGGRPGQDGFRNAAAPPAAMPEVTGADKDEDLFVFTVKGVTLKKGERMVLPVAEYELAYRDVYVLDLPFAPPAEVRANANESQQRELTRLLGAPRFTHVLRLSNSSRQPLTTAPALIASADRVLGQGVMSYTAPGSECDLALTAAVDVKVTKRDRETSRAPGGLTVDGSSYLRVNLQGSIAVDNVRDRPVDIEVTRSVLGHADTAGQAGRVEMVNAYEEGDAVARPAWWGWYGWPGWWNAVNGVGQFTWKARVEAGKSLTLTYTWHYFWR
jgi:hypothetical protein